MADVSIMEPARVTPRSWVSVGGRSRKRLLTPNISFPMDPDIDALLLTRLDRVRVMDLLGMTEPSMEPRREGIVPLVSRIVPPLRLNPSVERSPNAPEMDDRRVSPDRGRAVDVDIPEQSIIKLPLEDRFRLRGDRLHRSRIRSLVLLES